MKRILLPILGLVLAFSLVLPATPAAAAAPVNYPLYAGKTTLVGHVQVTNDSNNIYVSFVIDKPWLLVESHVAVATTLAGIPQSKGNPVPGKFAYTGNPAIIPLNGWKAGKDLIIAAHATVYSMIGDGLNWIYAKTVIAYDQGTLVGGGTIPTPLNNPYSVLAPPYNRYPLGFDLGGTGDGWIILGWGQRIYTGYVEGAAHWGHVLCVEKWPESPLEQAEVWAIIEGAPPIYLGIADNSGIDYTHYLIPLPEEVPWVDAIMLKDVTDPNLFGSDPYADGYDLYRVGVKWLIGGEETAWGADGAIGTCAFPGKNWATYFHYIVQ